MSKEINEQDFDTSMFLPGAIWESKKSHTKVMVICATNLKTTEAMAKEYQPSIVSWDGHTFYSCSFERFLKVRQYVGQNKDFNSKFMAMVSLPIEPKEEVVLDSLFSPFGTFFDAINNAQSIQSDQVKAKEQKPVEANAKVEVKLETKPETKPESKPYVVESTPDALAVTLVETKKIHQRNSDYRIAFIGEDLSKEDVYLLSRTAYSLETYRSPDSLSYVHAIKFDAQDDRKALFKALSKAQLIDTVSVSYLKEKVATIESSGVLSISTGVEDSGFFYKLELFEEGEADEDDSAEEDSVETETAQESQAELAVSTENMLAETHGVSDLVETVGQKESQGLIDKVKGFFK